MKSKSIRITADKAFDQAKKLLSEVPGGVDTALMRAVNRAAQSGKAQTVREVRARYTVKAGDIRKTLTTTKATRTNLEAEIVSRGSPLGLASFKHTPRTDTTGAARKRVRVAVKKEGGLKPLGQTFVFNGQIFSRNGKFIVATRGRHKDKRVEQVEKKIGPSVPSMIGNPEVVEAIEEQTQETVVKRLDHEVNRILKV